MVNGGLYDISICFCTFKQLVNSYESIKSSRHRKNVDNGTWFLDTISVQLDVPGVGWYNNAQPPAVLRYHPRC